MQLSQSPEGFAQLVWESFKEALRADDYFLSVPELLLIVRLSGVSVVATTYSANVFKVVGGSFAGAVDGDIVYVSLEDDGSGPVRGHFERMWCVAEMDDYQNGVRTRRSATSRACTPAGTGARQHGCRRCT